jgi:preprotein translocase subunit SecG
MGILGIFLLVIFIISCILLVFMVIIQDSDSDSLGGIFAGGSGSAFGSRSTNVVVKFTTVLGVLFFVTAFSLALINKSSMGNVESAAAQSATTTSSEWWNAQSQDSGSKPSDAAPAQGSAPAQETAPASGG